MISKEVLESMYLTTSVSGIARELGLTRPTVYAWFTKYGIERKSSRVEMTCYTCGNKKMVLRKVFGLSKRHFCCKRCYTEYQKTSEFRDELNNARIEKAESVAVRVKAGLERGY